MINWLAIQHFARMRVFNPALAFSAVVRFCRSLGLVLLPAFCSTALMTGCSPGNQQDARLPVAATPQVTTTSPAIIQLPAVITSPVASPVLDYPINSEEKSVFDYVNRARTLCGFGSVQRSESLDRSIGGHMNYLLQNDTWGHAESNQTGVNGFVGVSPSERAAAAGYVGPVGEALVGRLTAFQGGGLRGLAGLTTAGYHLADLFRPYGQIGLVVAKTGNTNLFSGNTIVGIQYGYGSRQPATGVSTYPCDGVMLLETKTYSTEWPNPLPNRDVSAQPLGHPIYVRGTENNRMVITSFEIRLQGASQSINTNFLTAANDPNAVLLPWEALLIPNESLQPNSVYNVSIVGQDAGVRFEKRFSFTTGFQ